MGMGHSATTKLHCRSPIFDNIPAFVISNLLPGFLLREATAPSHPIFTGRERGTKQPGRAKERERRPERGWQGARREGGECQTFLRCMFGVGLAQPKCPSGPQPSGAHPEQAAVGEAAEPTAD